MNLREYCILTTEEKFIPWLTRFGRMARDGIFTENPVCVSTPFIRDHISQISQIVLKPWSALNMQSSSVYQEIKFDQVERAKEYITTDNYEIFWHVDKEVFFKNVISVENDQTVGQGLKLLPEGANLDAVVREVCAIRLITRRKKGGRIAADQAEEKKFKFRYNYEIYFFDVSNRVESVS